MADPTYHPGRALHDGPAELPSQHIADCKKRGIVSDEGATYSSTTPALSFLPCFVSRDRWGSVSVGYALCCRAVLSASLGACAWKLLLGPHTLLCCLRMGGTRRRV